MYILKRILISLHSAVFPRENFVEILFLHENPSIRQFVANNAFQKLQYQSQAGYHHHHHSLFTDDVFIYNSVMNKVIRRSYRKKRNSKITWHSEKENRYMYSLGQPWGFQLTQHFFSQSVYFASS